jgi:hypothetical protein
VGGNGLVAVPVGQHLPDRGRRPPRADAATPQPLATQPRLPDTGERRAAWAAWPAPAGSRLGGSQVRRRRAWNQAKPPTLTGLCALRSHPPEPLAAARQAAEVATNTCSKRARVARLGVHDPSKKRQGRCMHGCPATHPHRAGRTHRAENRKRSRQVPNSRATPRIFAVGFLMLTATNGHR